MAKTWQCHLPVWGSFRVTASCVCPAGSFLGDPQLTLLNRPFSLICTPTGSAPCARCWEGSKAELDCSEHPPQLLNETFTPIYLIKKLNNLPRASGSQHKIYNLIPCFLSRSGAGWLKLDYSFPPSPLLCPVSQNNPCVSSPAPGGRGGEEDQVPGGPFGGDSDEEAGDKTSPL